MSYGKVTFWLDGRGVALNRGEWLHLDGLVSWAALYTAGDDIPEVPLADRGDFIEPKLPLEAVEVGGVRIYAASALFVDGDVLYTARWYRKRFNFDRASGVTSGTVLTGGGPYRDANQVTEVILCRSMVAYFDGDLKEVKRLLSFVGSLGKHRAMGFGRVTDISVEEISDDRSVAYEGRAMRYYPDPRGWRVVRPRPPYWNLTGAVNCLDPGDVI